MPNKAGEMQNDNGHAALCRENNTGSSYHIINYKILMGSISKRVAPLSGRHVIILLTELSRATQLEVEMS